MTLSIVGYIPKQTLSRETSGDLIVAGCEKHNKESIMTIREMSIDMDKLKADILASSDKTAIFIGGDSKTFKQGDVRYCAYCVTVVLHIDSKHGGKIYKDIKIERDYGDVTSPRARLMNEVYKVAAIASEIVDVIGDRPFEIHLDINPEKKHKSNAIAKEACGYVFGMFGIQPKIKPVAWCASAVADRDAVRTADKARRS